MKACSYVEESFWKPVGWHVSRHKMCPYHHVIILICLFEIQIHKQRSPIGWLTLRMPMMTPRGGPGPGNSIEVASVGVRDLTTKNLRKWSEPVLCNSRLTYLMCHWACPSECHLKFQLLCYLFRSLSVSMGRQQMIQWLGLCHLCGRPGWSSVILASSRTIPGQLGMEISGWNIYLSWPIPLSL